ncbi:MAG: DUF3068 domain-containing protein [Chloroflexi bacterium]|nr:DUF3068 domain-containing protein [Chloroflexota bacterium]
MQKLTFILILAAAAVLRGYIAPELLTLPADYANETRYAAEDNFRESATGEWTSATLIAHRMDQVIVATGGTDVVNSDLHWVTESGQVTFESTGLYGVDRRTRQNVRGYGNAERGGQFLFPPDVQPITYSYWDPMFIGTRVATFDRAETQDGLAVYVFRFSAIGLDETAGYSFLPDVPERYAAQTDGQGTLWIEPVSGVVVDYAEQGVSYFVDPATSQRVADFHEWQDRYTPETRAAQARLANEWRGRVWLAQDLAPGLLALGAVAWLVRARRKSNP